MKHTVIVITTDTHAWLTVCPRWQGSTNAENRINFIDLLKRRACISPMKYKAFTVSEFTESHSIKREAKRSVANSLRKSGLIVLNRDV